MSGEILTSVLAGAVGGAIYGLTGYAKEMKKADSKGNELPFDWISFGSTVTGSAILGGFATYQGIPFDSISTGAMSVLVTQYIKKLLKTLF